VLRRDGWSVATTGLRAYDAGESWGSQPEEAEEIGGGAFIEADLSNPEAPAQVLGAAEETIGPLTALVIVHTESRSGGVLDTRAADFDRLVGVNARSVLLFAEFARRFQGKTGSGRIVAFTSDAVHGEVAYGASKAALERIVVAAAAELGPLGITVNAINPGPTDTGWMSPELRESWSNVRRWAASVVWRMRPSLLRFSARPAQAGLLDRSSPRMAAGTWRRPYAAGARPSSKTTTSRTHLAASAMSGVGVTGIEQPC
jgi:3-oxoacyl-[acyl-carrier protein] reductase